MLVKSRTFSSPASLHLFHCSSNHSTYCKFIAQFRRFSKTLQISLVKLLLQKLNLDPNDLKKQQSNFKFVFLIKVNRMCHCCSSLFMNISLRIILCVNCNQPIVNFIPLKLLSGRSKMIFLDLLDAGHSTILLLLDLLAAFDTFDHRYSSFTVLVSVV